MAYAYHGSIIGLGAGQQSRIHCTRLAGSKADNWWLRHHPRVLALPFKKGVKRAEKANAIDLFVGGDVLEGGEKAQRENLFGDVPPPLSAEECTEHTRLFDSVACSSSSRSRITCTARGRAVFGISPHRHSSNQGSKSSNVPTRKFTLKDRGVLKPASSFGDNLGRTSPS